MPTGHYGRIGVLILPVCVTCPWHCGLCCAIRAALTPFAAPRSGLALKHFIDVGAGVIGETVLPFSACPVCGMACVCVTQTRTTAVPWALCSSTWARRNSKVSPPCPPVTHTHTHTCDPEDCSARLCSESRRQGCPAHPGKDFHCRSGRGHRPAGVGAVSCLLMYWANSYDCVCVLVLLLLLHSPFVSQCGGLSVRARV